MAAREDRVRLDLNNLMFQSQLFALAKAEQSAALKALRKISRFTSVGVYQDTGLKWERISSVRPPDGIEAIYSLRITRSCRAVAWREKDFMRFLTITPEHDMAYGKR